jgi:hypothetical protein
MKNKTLGLICAFLFAIILCGAVSATTTTTFSSDGKYINITHSYVPSTLKTTQSTKTETGIYGYGKYSIITISGKDNKGRNVNSTLIYYNNVCKSMNQKRSSSDGTFYNENAIFGSKSMSLKVYGRMNSTMTYSVNSTCNIYYVDGQALGKPNPTITNYYQNGKFYAQSKDLEVLSYKSFNGIYQLVSDTDTTNTVYANGNKRTSVIKTDNIINSYGTQTGMKISGTSYGTEKINNKTVTYTGKISISTKYDPKDFNQYNMGDYKEVLTSSSPTLLKIVPFESIDTS